VEVTQTKTLIIDTILDIIGLLVFVSTKYWLSILISSWAVGFNAVFICVLALTGMVGVGISPGANQLIGKGVFYGLFAWQVFDMVSAHMPALDVAICVALAPLFYDGGIAIRQLITKAPQEYLVF